MAVLSVYQHGATCGIPGNNHGMAGKRGVVQGWSHAATKNNIKFLRSVTLDELTGVGVAFTLTLKKCPPSGDEWHRLRRAFIKRLERAGMLRLHWVTEWQRRGVPHLHGVAYFPDDSSAWQFDFIGHWQAVAGTYGTSPNAQHTSFITDALGWLKYLSKHAARGVSHYQRSPESIPSGWKKTGRVWGHTGSWPIRPAVKIKMEQVAFYRYRRMVKNMRIADARASGNRHRLESARSMLKCNDRTLSELRGVSEWQDQELSLRMVELLAMHGYQVEC
jgi:hypothetical protein